MQGNKEQNQAIAWDRGAALILAGPGSGKTFTTVERIRYLIEIRHVDPSHILVITFTKAAARQMRDRFFTRMNGIAHPVSFGTFHAVFLHILKISCQYNSDCILSDKEKKEYLRTAAAGMPQELFGADLPPDGWEEGLLSEIGYVKNTGRLPADFSSAYLEKEVFRQLFCRFQKLLSEMGKLDLDDFAAAVRHLFLKKPEVLAAWQAQFSYILVDEFQDINAVQYEAVKLLAGETKNLFVVGDDDQAIYGFRGADPAILRQFMKDFPDAALIRLSVNYRSRPGIVETAAKLAAVNRERFAKRIRAKKAAEVFGAASPWRPLSADGAVQIADFCDRSQQASQIAQRMGQLLREQMQPQPFTTAAIFRTNTDAVLLAEALSAAGIAFQMKEKLRSPYQQPVCQDLLAYLLFAQKERSRQHFFRIMNKPCRYLSRQLLPETQVSFSALLDACREKPYLQQHIRKLQTDINRIAGMDLYAAVNYVRKAMGYDLWLKKELIGKAYQDAMEAADFFQNSVRAFFRVEELTAHIEQLEASLREAEKKQTGSDGAAVQLMTMHGAKGLEFDYVFLPDLNEGIIPHKKSMQGRQVEEERRIFYVGMTRAREQLYLSWVSGTRQEPGFPSRFLADCGYREPYR